MSGRKGTLYSKVRPKKNGEEKEITQILLDDCSFTHLLPKEDVFFLREVRLGVP